MFSECLCEFIFVIMADLSKPGSSGVKKRKIITVKNPKNLTVEEQMEFLYNSDTENEQEDQELDNRSECK